MAISNDLARGLKKVDKDLDFMMTCFVEVLEQLDHKDLAGTLPWMGKRKLRGVQLFSYRGVQAYSIAFQLLNMVEENVSARTSTASPPIRVHGAVRSAPSSTPA